MPKGDKEVLEEILEELEETAAEEKKAAKKAEEAKEDKGGSAEASKEADDTDKEADSAAETADNEAAETEENAGDGESRSFSEKRAEKKKAKADKKQDAFKEKIDELEDKVKRQMAEFDNFRKRTEKEKSQMFETGAKSVIEKILPVVDNFERGLASIPEEEKGKGFADGMNMIYKQLMTELENLGVKPIEAVGQEFNPEFHNAVMQVESEEYESGVVAQELQKGYMYRDSVVRHSMVAVAT